MEDNNEKSEHEMWSGSGNSSRILILKMTCLTFSGVCIIFMLVCISLKFACFGNH